MAGRSDAAGDYFSITTGLPSMAGAFTLALHAYISADRNDYSIPWKFEGVTSNPNLSTDSTGTAWIIGSDSLESSAYAVATGEWHHLTWVHRSNTDNELWVDGVLRVDAFSMTTTTGSLSALRLFRYDATYWFNGRLFAIKFWTAALSAAEIAQEVNSIRPTVTENLYGWWPLFPGSGERVRDYSGNGHHWTESGTFTDEDPPPISWGAPIITLPYVAAGGTQYTSTLTGGVTSAGALVRQAQAVRAGAVASAGALVRQEQTTKAGAVASAGALVRQAQAVRAGAVASAGALVKQDRITKTGTVSSAGALMRQAQAVRAGAVASAGALGRQTAHALSGTVSSAGATVKQTARSLSGGVTSSGVMTTIRAVLMSLTGSIASAGALGRQTAHTLSGTVSSAGETVKQTARGLSGAVTSSGAMSTIRAVLMSLTGSIASAGALSRQTAHTLSGSVASAGETVRQTARSLSGAVASSGAVSTIRAVLVSLTGAIASAGALGRQTARSLSGSVTSSGTITKYISISKIGSMVASGVVAAINALLGGRGHVVMTDMAYGSVALIETAARITLSDQLLGSIVVMDEF